MNECKPLGGGGGTGGGGGMAAQRAHAAVLRWDAVPHSELVPSNSTDEWHPVPRNRRDTPAGGR